MAGGGGDGGSGTRESVGLGREINAVEMSLPYLNPIRPVGPCDQEALMGERADVRGGVGEADVSVAGRRGGRRVGLYVGAMQPLPPPSPQIASRNG